jgi:hypothetical protein
MKILPVATELFYADGRAVRQTDMTKLIVAFGHFEKAPKDQSEGAVYGNRLCLLKTRENTYYKQCVVRHYEVLVLDTLVYIITTTLQNGNYLGLFLK